MRMPESCTSSLRNGEYDGGDCKASCPAELYESRGMTPYDVLFDTVALHWLAPFTGGIIVSRNEIDRIVLPNRSVYRIIELPNMIEVVTASNLYHGIQYGPLPEKNWNPAEPEWGRLVTFFLYVDSECLGCSRCFSCLLYF